MSLSIKYFVYFITIQMYHHPSSITMYHHLSPFIHCALIKSHRASHFWRLQPHKQITVQELLKSHYITLFRSPFPLTLWLFYIPIGSMYGIYANIGGILMVNVTIYSIHGSYGIYNIVLENDRVIQEKNDELHIKKNGWFSTSLRQRYPASGWIHHCLLPTGQQHQSTKASLLLPDAIWSGARPSLAGEAEKDRLLLPYIADVDFHRVNNSDSDGPSYTYFSIFLESEYVFR